MSITCEFFKKTMSKFLLDFGIKNHFGGIVSNGARNMTSAFDNSEFKRHYCICHVMNLILSDLRILFLKKFHKLEYIQAKTKNSTAFTNICEIHKCSLTKISSYSQTRWYSLYKTVHSFNITYDCLVSFM